MMASCGVEGKQLGDPASPHLQGSCEVQRIHSAVGPLKAKTAVASRAMVYFGLLPHHEGWKARRGRNYIRALLEYNSFVWYDEEIV